MSTTKRETNAREMSAARPLAEKKTDKHMLFAGWEDRIVKNWAEVLKMLPEAAGRGHHFQARGHGFSLCGP